MEEKSLRIFTKKYEKYDLMEIRKNHRRENENENTTERPGVKSNASRYKPLEWVRASEPHLSSRLFPIGFSL